jgi:hypothetical protein
MPKEEEDLLSIINIVFTVIFTVEVILKLIGLGIKEFCVDRFNIFDATVVIISLIELSISDGGGALSALRAFRLFRIFKIFRVGDLRVLLDSIAFTLTTIGNYTVLLILFIYVYSLLGMQFFAGKLKFDENDKPDMVNGIPPRENYDSLGQSFITIFLILIGDNWNSVMYNCMRTGSALASAYFITLILFGNIIMLNLFLAILLGNFDKARHFITKKKVFEGFLKSKEKNCTLNKALDRVLGEAADHVRNKILKDENLEGFLDDKNSQPNSPDHKNSKLVEETDKDLRR